MSGSCQLKSNIYKDNSFFTRMKIHCVTSCVPIRSHRETSWASIGKCAMWFKIMPSFQCHKALSLDLQVGNTSGACVQMGKKGGMINSWEGQIDSISKADGWIMARLIDKNILVHFIFETTGHWSSSFCVLWPVRYHCHTCKMIDGVGICTVCARVCHRGHEVAYAKYGSFFCDCGDKDDGGCLVSNMRLFSMNMDKRIFKSSTKESIFHKRGTMGHVRKKKIN